MKKRVKFMFMIVLSLIMCSGLFIVNKTQAEAMRCELSVRNCNSYVTLRKSPSAKSKALAKVYYGKTVRWVYGYNNGKAKNGFYKVFYGYKQDSFRLNILGI